ncbi:uncharacterized protein LOC109860552 [Pseudomyrmex gracilis]|uniref:uncharacterized protein LOC109860552 n=1 Tax=Pseudomyrmex gracilis TaxID=219809 RepID=UPI0009954D9D|nr:uncharacterized protein LOC109860552 [Pseudomyrmex gracilis]XP_020295306.1 uncharacterized protein LOC109860552 [Pseudomyrmex gracilis]XP_020295307.1 uncharacterized protein LOC109860552 [Pseudomyrmex gracilis]
MSQTSLISSTSDKNQRNRWNAIITGYKHSTPDSDRGRQIKPLSLSLSQIESTSSTESRKAVEKKLSSSVLGEKRKKKVKKISSRKKRVLIRRKDTDSEWETDTEESIGFSDNKNVTIGAQSETSTCNVSSLRINLFENKRSSKTGQKVSIKDETSLNDSPIIMSSRSRSRFRRTEKKDIQIAQQDKLLSVNLSPTKAQIEESIKNFDNEVIQSQTQASINHVFSPRINLFEDEKSPETVRDIPIENENLLNDSLIIMSSRQFRHIRKDDVQIAQQDELLPINLPPTETEKNYSGISENEDELIFCRKSNVKTYPSARKVKPDRYITDFLYPPTFSLPSLSDILWDQFIGKRQDERTQNLTRAPITSSSASLPVVSAKSKTTLIPQSSTARDRDKTSHKQNKDIKDWNNSEYEDIYKTRKRKTETYVKNQTKTQKKAKTKSVKNKTTRQKEKKTLFRHTQRERNVYSLDNTDGECDTGGADGRKITFSEFRHRQMMKKKSSTNSHLNVEEV